MSKFNNGVPFIALHKGKGIGFIQCPIQLKVELGWEFVLTSAVVHL